jgi:hypothetical protein
MKTISLNTFRRVEKLEEQMIRSCMPRVSASDPAPLTSAIRPAAASVNARVWSAGSLVTKGAFTFAEVVTRG